MFTFVNLLLLILAVTAVSVFAVVAIGEWKARKTTPDPFTVWETLWLALTSSILITVILAVLFAVFVGSWSFVLYDEDRCGEYVYETVVADSNIVYNGRFDGGYSVFIDGEERVCQYAIIGDTANFVVKQSEYKWKSGWTKFFFDNILRAHPTYYRLEIPERYVKDGFIAIPEN